MSTTSFSFESPQPPPLPGHRFTVQQYHQLGESGVLTPEDKVELLEGWIVKKMNQRPAHGFTVGILNQWLHQNLGEGWIVRCQLPITLASSEPDPDLAVVHGDHSDFRTRHPAGDDCRLVIEVADTSLSKDMAKATIYAAAGVEEYWIVNLVDQNLLRYRRNESSTAFQDPDVLCADDQVAVTLNGVAVQLSLDTLLDV